MQVYTACKHKHVCVGTQERVVYTLNPWAVPSPSPKYFINNPFLWTEVQRQWTNWINTGWSKHLNFILQRFCSYCRLVIPPSSLSSPHKEQCDHWAGRLTSTRVFICLLHRAQLKVPTKFNAWGSCPQSWSPLIPEHLTYKNVVSFLKPVFLSNAFASLQEAGWVVWDVKRGQFLEFMQKEEEYKDRGMALWLRVHTLLAEVQNSVPSTHSSWLTASRNSRLHGDSGVCGLWGHCTHGHTNTHTSRYIHTYT